MLVWYYWALIVFGLILSVWFLLVASFFYSMTHKLKHQKIALDIELRKNYDAFISIKNELKTNHSTIYLNKISFFTQIEDDFDGGKLQINSMSLRIMLASNITSAILELKNIAFQNTEILKNERYNELLKMMEDNMTMINSQFENCKKNIEKYNNVISKAPASWLAIILGTTDQKDY